MAGAAVAGVLAILVVRDPEDEVFCYPSLAMTTVSLTPTQVLTVALEDQGEPGPGDCDNDELPSGGGDFPVLGYDCQIRTFTGSILGRSEPNRADGTCGQDERS